MVSEYIGNSNPDGPWTNSPPPKTRKKPITNTIKQKYYPESGSSKGNLKGLPKAALDSKFTTLKKTIGQLRYDKVPYKMGMTNINPTISQSYDKVIKKQYPKYTGPKAPHTGGGFGPQKMFEGTAREYLTKGEFVDGGRRRAVGQYSDIPENYLKNQMNKNQFLARSAKVSKGMATAGKIIRTGNVVGTALLAYDAMKWAQQWHQDNPNYNKEKYKNYSYTVKSSPEGTKRALSPGGTQFHTGTGVPIWEDRNRANQNTKLNY